MPRDDARERFDLCDADGRSLGRTKARGRVHRDGDWHRSLHLWVILESAVPKAVLWQRRSASKDVSPGKVDVSVAGHLRAGESVEGALRESEEEIGLVVRPSAAVYLGTRRHVHGRPGECFDRELQEVFFTMTSRPLETLRPDPHEVAALLTVPLGHAMDLSSGRVTAVSARELSSEEGVVREVTLHAAELTAAPDDYFAKALSSIERRLAGLEEPPWRLAPFDRD